MKNPPKIDSNRLKNLLKEMVDIYSPSGKEEEIIDFAESYLTAHDLEVTRQEVDENRCNLIVMPPDSNGSRQIDVCLVGHLDTVVAYDLEDYEFYEEEEGQIYGLGTVDMKGGCAAMMEAFTALAERDKKLPPIALALVVGEEEENDGAKALAREYDFQWAIIGEPTDLKPCLGHYGYLEVLLRTKGKRAHSSMPELGRNAIETMLKLLLKFTEYSTQLPHEYVYNISQLSGFPGGFVVPDGCEALLELHLPPDSRIDLLKTQIEKLLDQSHEGIPGLDAYIRFENTYSGYRISEERALVKTLKKVYQKSGIDWDPQDFRSHSDGSILWAGGIDPIILGPGKLEAAHTPEESISFEQVTKAAELYLNFALSLS